MTESGGVHRVVIVGAGFGGLFAAKFLRRAPVEATLVDRTNHHVFQPLLYHVATGILSSGEIAPATRDVLRKHDNVGVELGEVTGFDLEARQVMVTRPGRAAVTLPYDSLIVAAGVGGSYFGHDEFEQWAPGMKTLADALAQRERIFGAFELAELEQDPEARQALLTFAVVGGGPTGVEIAGQIAELAHRALKHNFRNFDPASVRVVLFDGGKEILANFGDKLSAKAASGLEQTGVEIHTGSIVTHVDADGVDVKGPDGEITRYAAKTTIWAAGVPGLAAREAAGRRVRCRMRPRRAHQGAARLLAARAPRGVRGRRHDEPRTISREWRRSRCRPGIHAARTIKKRVESGAEPKPFKYRDLGSMAAISRRRAIVSFHGLRVSGWLGWLMWMFVHLAFMTGFKNRFTAGLHWMMAFGGRGRAQRAIVGDRDRRRLTDGDRGTDPGGRRLIVPAYAYPAPATQLWDGAIAAADCVRFVIANPADGPGQLAHASYVGVIARVRASGIRVLGYVDTHYGERPAALVKADVDAWRVALRRDRRIRRPDRERSRPPRVLRGHRRSHPRDAGRDRDAQPGHERRRGLSADRGHPQHLRGRSGQLRGRSPRGTGPPATRARASRTSCTAWPTRRALRAS